MTFSKSDLGPPEVPVDVFGCCFEACLGRFDSPCVQKALKVSCFGTQKGWKSVFGLVLGNYLWC